MKTFIIYTILASVLFAGLKDDLNHLSSQQREVLKAAYDYGEPFDLGYTLAAIAWKESSFGIDLISETDDYGVFQINLYTYKNRFSDEITDLNATDMQLQIILINDFATNASAAIAELTFWRSAHSGDYTKMLESYNGGWRGNPQYADKVKDRVKVLIQYRKSGGF